MDKTESTVCIMLTAIEAPLYAVGVLSARGMLPTLYIISPAAVRNMLLLPKYRKPDGLFPFVRLHSHSGQQYPMAEAFEQEITTLYEAREQEHEARRLQNSLSPRRGPRLSNLSLERFRTSIKYHDRPAAAD